MCSQKLIYRSPELYGGSNVAQTLFGSKYNILGGIVHGKKERESKIGVLPERIAAFSKRSRDFLLLSLSFFLSVHLSLCPCETKRAERLEHERETLICLLMNAHLFGVRYQNHYCSVASLFKINFRASSWYRIN